MRPTTFSLRTFTVLAVVCLIGMLTASAHSAAIRQVQTGEVAFTTISQTVTLPTTLNNTANAILFFSERCNNANSDQFLVRGNITNATTLTFVRNVAGASVSVRWYVAEFDSGVTVQRGDTTQTTTTTNKTISSVNLAESFVLVSRERSGPAFSNDDFLRSRLTSSTNLEMALNSGTLGTNSWQVVTFAGSLVQRNIVSLATGSASTTVTIPTPVDTTRSFLLFSYSSPNGTAANIGQKMLSGWLSASNQITFQRANTGGALAIAWEVVQLPVGNTVIEALSSQAAAVATSDVTFSALDTNRTVAFSGSQSLGGQSWGRSNYSADDNPGVASFTHRLLNKTTLRLERSFTTNAANSASFVVKFSAPTETGIVRVGNWTTGLTHAPGIGDNRLLVFSVGYENATDVGVSSVTFGGQAMTRIGGAVAGTTTVARTDLWRLNEAGILAATNNNFVVTWGGTAPTEPKYGAATFRNVNQTSPVGNSSGAFTNAATPNPLTTTVTVLAGGMSVSNIFCGNAGSYTWNNSYVEGFDQGTGSSTMSSANRIEASAGSSIASATHSGPNRQAIFAAALVPFGSSPNSAPVLASIGPRNVNEGANLNFNISATDPDLTTPTFTAQSVPANATFIDNGNGTATFNFNPSYAQAGVFNVLFIASDGTLADSESVAITVANINPPPVLATIGPRNVNEGANLNFIATATDPDGATPTLSAVNLPATATFVNNGNGTGTFNFTPSFSQSGVYNVTFIASDGTLADSEVVAITVNNVNRAPELAAIGAKSVNEGVLLTFGTSATDPDATPITMIAQNSPAGAIYTDNGNGTATYNFTPTFSQSGVYNVRFIASDGSLADTEIVVLTVNNVNRPPVLAAIGPKSVNEGVLLTFGTSATDPDATPLTMIVQNSPAGATYTDNGNGTATFNFTPTFAQAGVFNNVRFITSDGSLADTELVTITVNNVNQAPVLAAIGPKSVNENVLLTFATSATDVDATPLTMTVQNSPSGATYTDNGNGTATFNWTPTFSQSGSYPGVRFIVSDGSLADTELVTITVNNVNRAPVLAAIGPKSVNEGVLLTFGTTATDPDATPLTMIMQNAPAGATYTDNGNGTATFNWTPTFSQSGSYPNVRFIASDGSLADTELVTITVNNVNQAPVLAAIGAQSINEGVLLTFGTSATDPDATFPTLTVQNAPVGASYIDNGNGTATFNWTPTFSQSGSYPNVRFIASDGALADTELVTITVNNVNQAPVLAAVGAQSVNEGILLTFGTSATDPDATTPAMTVQNAPAGATYTDNGNGTATFNFTPTFSQSGVYPNVRFIASDGSLADTELVTITINNVNRAPVLAAIGAQSVNEGVLLTFGTSATDPDATFPALTVQNAPAGATYTDNGNGTATFNFTPTFSQSGVYPNVRFIASDGSLADTELVIITVNNVNQAPVLAAIGPRSVDEGALLTFGTSATDPDATVPVLTVQNSPAGATYVDNGNGTATFNFTPTFAQSGIYPNVRFIASDGSSADTELVTITVNNVNRAPVLAAIGAQSVNEGVLLTFGTSASDPDATPLTMTVQNSPAGATYTDNGNGTATFNFTPTLSQSGVYPNVRFISSDGSLADTELVTITVNNVNQAPVLAAIGAKSVNEGVLLTFGTSATDFDATPLTMTAQDMPAGATYTDNGNGTATFNFTPLFSQSGLYNVRFIVGDGSLADTELVAITVNNVNQTPVLAAIGARNVNENVNLNFNISSTDGDGTTPVLVAEDVPTNATFVDNANGTGTFDFNPDFTQAGVYSVRFIASDGSLADTELVAVTVNNVNRAPVLASIGAQSVNEGALLTFGTSTTDPDATIPALTVQNAPAGATYTDNGNGTATFSFTPTFAQSGVYPNVRFIASDGSLADTELVTITVNNVNLAPVLAAIGAQSVNEGVLLTFGTTASDFDATPLTMTVQNAPAGATYTDNGNGTATFNFTPTFAQSGVYPNVRFIASDGSLADTELVTITVNNVNLAPVLAAIGAQSVNEGVLLTFGTSATDFDATPLTMTVQNAPVGATYTDNGNGTATFNFTPTFAQSGVYPNVRFIASDGSLADTELVTITVNNVNLAPVLAAIGAQSVNEGVLLTFGTSATDPDATFPALTVQNAPAGATYTDNGNGTATFDFTPTFSQSGVYPNVRFIASDGSLADTELVTITVNNVNQAPVLASIGPRSVNENANLNFNVSATDVDATTPSLTAVGIPTNATFTDNGDGTGTFDFNPDFSQAGIFNVTFIASDGVLADSELVAITVNNTNRAPVLAAIGAKSVNEGVLLTFGTSASDPDATAPVLTVQNAPAGASYTDNGNGTATFSFTPTFAQSGVYNNVRFIASDGSLADTELVTITVNDVNQAPVLTAIGAKNVNEGVLLTFGTSASDFDATPLTMTAENTPVGATYIDNGNGTATFNFTPNFTQAAIYNVRFIVSDGSLTDTELVTITVNNVNLSPVLAAIGPRSVSENTNLNFIASATDADGTTPALVAQNVPVNATFTDNGNGTGTFDFNPDFTQAGVFNVRFIASDGSLADTEMVAITVNNVNRAPVLASIGAQNVNEGVLLSFGTSATDPDATFPVLTVQNAPVGATYTDNGNGTATFNFTPTFSQSGVYPSVRFIASDGTLADTELVTITVSNVNQAPVLAAIGPKSVNEGVLLTFGTSASDFDATPLTMVAQNSPAGATYTDNGNGTATFNFTPSLSQSGVYSVRFIVSDGSLADTEIVAITVSNVNQPPVIAAIGPKNVNEGVLLTFGTSASDFDATPLTMTAQNTPAGATYTDNGNGTATFTFTPTLSQSGIYNVRFIASDGSLADTEMVAITVNNVNQAPVLVAIGSKVVDEGSLLTFGTSASDFDATPLTMTAQNSPAGATYTDNGNGTATFSFSPTFSQSGLYNVRFIVSDGSLADTEMVAITVNDINRAPVLAAIGARSVNEGQVLNFGVSATDPESTIPVLTAQSVPVNANFVDNGNGTGTFNFAPNFTQSGVYNVLFIASDGIYADSELVAITVSHVNLAPVLASIGPRSVTEGQVLNFGVNATDADATTPTLSAESVPANATFIDNGNGSGSFSFNPNYIQAGVYNVRFIASDGVLADSEVVVVTVNEAGNQTPVLAPIGNKSVTEGNVLSFRLSATDPEFAALTLFTSILPSGAVFVDSGNGAASLIWTPGFTQAGTYFVTFAAQDPPGAVDNELVRIDVLEAGNQRPVLAAIGPRSVQEGSNLNFVASATDADATTPTLSAVNLPANATFVNNGNGTGTFNFNAAFGQAGVYNVTFIATDGSLADSELVAITVGNVNEAPILASIGPRSVNEGVNLSFGVSATDPDLTVPTLIAQNVPTNATFIDNGNGTGTFNFTPDFTQANVYNVRFIASDGSLADTEIVAVTVTNVNRAPVLAAIGAKSVNEGVILTFGTSATDPDLTNPALTVQNAPAGASYTDNGNGTATFNFTPTFAQSGVYNARFIASDGSLADTEIVVITVNNVNLSPVLAAIGPKTVNEGILLTFGTSATDPDGTFPVMTAQNAPSGATYTDNGNGTATFNFTPSFAQSGIYNVRFIASDGTLADTELVVLTVTEFNLPPVLAAIGAKSVNEGVLLSFGVSATDPDASTPALVAQSAPSGATFTDNGNGTGTFNFTPTFSQSGVYNVRFIASDGALADTEIVAITVSNVNLAPVLAAIGAKSVDEGALLTFGTSATDFDATPLTMTAQNTPAGATYTDNGNGTATFNFTSSLSQSGVYNVRFIVSDGSLADTEIVAVTVNNVNQAPVLAAIGAKLVNEGALLTFGTSASDFDATPLTMIAQNAPAGATYIDNGNGTATFNFTPTFSQSGLYNVRFIVSDGSLADTEIVAITVNNVNQAPVLAAIGPKTGTEGVLLTFGTSATDVDATPLTMTAQNTPSGATYTDNGNGTATFNFTPTFVQAGVYPNVRFIVSDGALADTELVTITINESGNQAPVLATIGSRTVTEGLVLNFNISATDPDATLPSFVAQSVPANATFIDNGNGTGTLNFAPSFVQAGIYNVRFIASDGSLTDTELVAITVSEAGNQAPILATIGPRIVTEGLNLNFNISATDPDATIPAFVAQNTPANSTFLDNGNGTGTFNFNPDFTQAGVYNVRFIATDGSRSDTEIVTVTVNSAGNQRPVLATIGPRSVNENQLLNFAVSAADPDATTPVLFAQLLPSGALFDDNGNGTGDFDWTPTFAQSGVYNVRFIATDGLLADTEIVAITVNNVNRAPVLAAIGAKSVNEGILLTFATSATDADATPLTMTAQNTPSGATYTDNGNGTATFNFTPTLSQSGVYPNVRFIVSDGSLADTELVTITVNNVNQSPVLAAIGPKSVNEGVLLTFGTTASDFDATPLTMTAQNSPAGATYTDNGNGTATFTFTPTFAQSGVYNVRFIVSDGSLSDTEIVVLTVNNVNQAPVLASIGARLGTEGVLLTFGTSASDIDATPLTMTAQNTPAGATYTDNGNGTATFNFTPTFVQAGVYPNVRFIVSDGTLADTELVTITISESGNQSPVLATIGPRSVTEGLVLNFNISATDPDATTPSFVAQSVPTNATFIDNGDGTGTFSFAPNFIQAGVYNVRFIATDGALADTEMVAVTVNEAGNQRPVLATIGPRSVNEGLNLNFGISASDADSTIPTLLAQNMPSNATFINNGNGTGTFNFNPDFTQAGVYSVRFIATDGSLADTEVVAITVNSAGNQRPVLAPIGARSTNENQNLNFDITATDADATTPTLIAQLVPAGATFTNNGDGTGTFDWTPSFIQAGVYNVRFIATDGSLADTEMVAITVNNVNRAPVLAAIGPRSVNEGVLLAFGTSATDADATPLTMSAQNTPSGASYTDNGNGTASFNFTPTLTQSGVYSVRFIVSDGSLADTEIVAITVNNSNQAPVLAPIGPKTVNEGVLLTFGTSASDFDATPLTMIAQSAPAGATYIDNGNGTATFNFTPTFSQSGLYNVRFIVSDGSLADTEIVAITVNNVNQAPVLAAIGAQSGAEGVLLTFGTSATDFDATPLTMIAESAPAGATHTDNGNGTATFNFTPTFVQAGVYNVRFIASDGSLADSELVTITINESGNQAPVLAAIGSRSVTEGLVLNFNISGTDPDATTPSFIAQNVPTNASFIDNGNGTGAFNFAPNFAQAGVFNVRFIATDGSLSDTEMVAITVNEAGNQRPVLATIGPRAVTEGLNLNFNISATDPDATTPSLVAQNTPANSTFLDNGNGTGTFNFNPDFTQAGVYNVRFIATDGSLADTEVVVVTVNSAGNQRPVLAAIGPRSVNENQNLNFSASATDADATTPTLIAQLLPSGATFSNNGDGTGTFDWTPSFAQSGVYSVRFIATDGSLADTELVSITVNNVNLPPVLAAIGPKSVSEGVLLTFGTSATDPDATPLTMTAQNTPVGATYTDNGNGTATFSFTPTLSQSGLYNVRFIVSDGALADTELVAITVNNSNQAPVWAAIGPKSVNEGVLLAFGTSATDFDATPLTMTAQSTPSGSTYSDNGNGTATFNFTPTFSQSGVYNVTFIVSDGLLADTEMVAITVNNVNLPPVLATIGPRSVNENANLNFGISGSDPDGTTPTFVAQNVPANATFTDNANGTGTFNFNPDFTQSGIYSVRFIASDGVLADTELVAITVNNVNAPPILAPIGARSVAESATLNFNISAADVDATIPSLTALSVPANATFVNNGNGTGTFNFTPNFAQSGVYNVTFIASDGTLADSEIVQITVTENNRPPVANAGADQGPLPIGSVVTLNGSGSTDPDGDSLTYLWSQVAGSVVSISTLGSNAFFTPAVAGIYRFSLRVSDGQIQSPPDTTQLTVVSEPDPITDLMATVAGNSIQLSWSPVTTDTSGAATTLNRYVVFRGTRAYFTPTTAESIGVAVPAAVAFTDNNLGGADVVGDTGTNYFYCLRAVDAGGGLSAASNRVGEYDYQIYTTSSTDFTLIMLPFTNTGISTASDLIQSIGIANVNTLNRFIATSQSYESRFAAGFGPNFAVAPGGVYQVNAKTPTVWSIAGRVPNPGSFSYPIITTSTTDFSFIGIPFEHELTFTNAQSVINSIPGVLNTLNRFIPASQSYESRFAAGFGPNFPVKAGRVYQANAVAAGTFPAP